MEINDLLNLYIKKVDSGAPPVSALIIELLEAWAALKDHEVNNQLLEELVLKYAAVEKQLKQLNRELLWQQKRIYEDLQAAADIQKSLLPQRTDIYERVDVAWYFEPCDKIGGDIFNMIQPDEDHCIIYMLDVSGHGVPAAMVTVSVSQLMQLHTGFLIKAGTGTSLEHKIKSPAEVLDALDREFPFERFNNFFTINYLILNTKTGITNYANAGHPKPVLLRNNGSIEELESSGPPIGTRGLSFTDEKILFKAEQIQIYPGDKLMFYTDGLVEYYNNNHEYYGHSRFFDSLKEHAEKSVADIVDATINSLKLFGNNAKPADDVTLLGIELY